MFLDIEYVIVVCECIIHFNEGYPFDKKYIDEVINLTENCYYVTVDDVRDLCDLREIGFKNVRWTGGCWIAEKDENDVNGDKHGGMLVCLSTRVGRMLYEVCKKENKNENDRIRNKVEDLMYDLYDGLNKMMVLTSGMGIICET